MKKFLVVTPENYEDQIIEADYYDIGDGHLDLFLANETLVATFVKDFWKAVGTFTEEE